jgi:hypothetical protein
MAILLQRTLSRSGLQLPGLWQELEFQDVLFREFSYVCRLGQYGIQTRPWFDVRSNRDRFDPCLMEDSLEVQETAIA